MYKNKVFIFEFKLDKSTEEAYFKIENKAYADKFKNSGMPTYKIGVKFSSETRKVAETVVILNR